MNQKQQITKFIKHVADNNYSKANQLLSGIINEKLKNLIIIFKMKRVSY